MYIYLYDPCDFVLLGPNHRATRSLKKQHVPLYLSVAFSPMAIYLFSFNVLLDAVRSYVLIFLLFLFCNDVCTKNYGLLLKTKAMYNQVRQKFQLLQMRIAPRTTRGR